MSEQKLVIGDPPSLLNSKVVNWTDVVVVDGKCYDKDAVAKLLAERDVLALEVDEANERNAQLVEERDALAAHALALKELSEFWINQAKPQPDCSKQDYNLWLALGYKSKALTQTPKQYLHDLKVAAYQQACVDFCAVDSGALSDLQPLIDQYSERLKAEDVLHERQLFRVGG